MPIWQPKDITYFQTITPFPLLFYNPLTAETLGASAQSCSGAPVSTPVSNAPSTLTLTSDTTTMCDVRQKMRQRIMKKGKSSVLWLHPDKSMGTHIQVYWQIPCSSSGSHYFTMYKMILKEKLPQVFMQIWWMESDFRNLTAKVWGNLDNPTKSYDFSKFWLISCMLPSQVALCYNMMSQQYNSLKGTVHKFHKILLFIVLPLLLYIGMLGLRWLCMHLWLNLINQIIFISKKKKKKKWKSMFKVNRELFSLWYHRFWKSSIQRGHHAKLCIISSLKWIIQICSNFLLLGL